MTIMSDFRLIECTTIQQLVFPRIYKPPRPTKVYNYHKDDQKNGRDNNHFHFDNFLFMTMIGIAAKTNRYTYCFLSDWHLPVSCQIL